jgi:cyclopropane-fatty-acyl-phospholipid synthase
MKAVVEFFLKRMIRKGHLRITAPGMSMIEIKGDEGGPDVALRLHDKALLFKLVQDFTLHLGEAYMDGRATVDHGTLYDLLELFAMNYHAAPIMPWDVVADALSPIERILAPQNSIASSRRNVAHHYDLSADFFKLFLDRDMQYSCAYFTEPTNDLDTAQLDKKRLIAAKLLLKKGMHVLDIGCGFGGMAIYLAKTFDVEVTGITLSTEQHKIAVERARQENVQDRVHFELQDYRNTQGSFDRIVSVGMFEHVGLEHYREFFTQMKSLLKPDGVALLHSIGRLDVPGTPDNWVNKYIFPGGYAPALSEVLPFVEKTGLYVTDVELLRLHYAATLASWRANFDAQRDAVRKMYDERFCRMWEFFLVGAEMDFRYGRMAVFQMQLAKDIQTVPLTRDYIFRNMLLINLEARSEDREAAGSASKMLSIP